MGEIQKSSIDNLRDSIVNCLVNQIDFCKDIGDFKVRYCDDMSNCLKTQMDLYRDMSRFSKILSEFNEKLSKFDDKLENDLVDYIDNYIEAYLKLEKKRRKIERDNINKVWWYLFFISFLCIVLYLTIL